VRKFHLWRDYPQRPYHRFACTIEEDPRIPGGYIISRADGDVAGIRFLQSLQTHFAKPVRSTVSVPHPSGRADGVEILHPGQKGYFEVAVRLIPAANIGAAP
jgi:hypothetical protein